MTGWRVFAAVLLAWLWAAPAVAADTSPESVAPCPGRPVAANSHGIDYPLLSQALNEAGQVGLDFIIQPDGSVSDVKLVHSSGFARLDGAAVDSAKQSWRYNPVVIDGKPVSCRWQTNVDFRFQLTAEQLAATGPFTIIRMRPSDYPADALARHEEGTTAVTALFDETGKILRTWIAQPSDYPELDKVALASVQNGKWHVTPATIDGKPERTVIGFAIVWAIPAPSPPGAKP